MQHYHALNVKQVQNDTLSHFILARASTFSLAAAGDIGFTQECIEASNIYVSNSADVSLFFFYLCCVFFKCVSALTAASTDSSLLFDVNWCSVTVPKIDCGFHRQSLRRGKVLAGQHIACLSILCAFLKKQSHIASRSRSSQIPDFIAFEDRLDNSLQRDLVKLEHVRMRLTHEGPTAEIIDSEYVELKFIFDRRQSFFSLSLSLSPSSSSSLLLLPQSSGVLRSCCD